MKHKNNKYYFIRKDRFNYYHFLDFLIYIHFFKYICKLINKL